MLYITAAATLAAVLSWVFARGKSQDRNATVWGHWQPQSPGANLCLQAALAQPGGCMLAQEASGEARSSHDFLRNSLLFAGASQGALQGQTHPRRRLMSAFQASSFACSGRACSHAGHGVGWLGRLRAVPCMSSGQGGRQWHPLPGSPLGQLRCCIQARAFAFTQLSEPNISGQRGSHVPPLPRHQLPQPAAKPPTPRGSPCLQGPSPCSAASHQPCLCQGTGAFPPIVFLVRPSPLAARLTTFPQERSPSASQPLALQNMAQGAGW